MNAMNANSGIDFGTAVLCYNQWTGYENQTVGRFFRQATAEDIRRLQPGDVVWLDEDPIHPNGKVYGFVKTKVEGVEGDRVYFQGGFTTLHGKIHFVSDEAELAKLIASDPLMTDVIGTSGRQATRILKQRGLL